MYRQRRRSHHLVGIRLQRPTMIPSTPSGPGPCILLSAFLVLPHPSQLVGQSKCNLQCIVRKSARGPKRQQQHFAACLACLWPGLDWQTSPQTSLIVHPSGMCISLCAAIRSALRRCSSEWRSEPRPPQRSTGPNPGPRPPGHSSCAYVVLLARRLSFEGRVYGIDSY